MSGLSLLPCDALLYTSNVLLFLLAVDYGLHDMLADFEVLPVSSLRQHSIRRRDVTVDSQVERLFSFTALNRYFKLYLTSNRNLFAKDFKVEFLDGSGQRKRYDVQLQNYFSGHVVGEEHSRVQAHIDGSEFSAHILTDEAEYNVEPLWRFTEKPDDDRLLVYRSEDIRNISRIASPKVCGYVQAKELIPEGAQTMGEEEVEGHLHREKRQAHSHKKNTCPLLLVADYRFFTYMGRKEESTTLNYLVRDGALEARYWGKNKVLPVPGLTMLFQAQTLRQNWGSGFFFLSFNNL
uniref:Peptidase M12B propeptide domain-containing protein n=1 Tax=Paramormyrops kingsleyae TaxID=1676925 RepID=A0A3B3Q715_9TELE